MASNLLFLIFSLCIFNNVLSKTLIVLEDDSLRNTHSQFLNYLTKNFNGQIKLNSDRLFLYQDTIRVYDNLVLLTPSIDGLGGKLTPDDILKFVDDGGNLLITADKDLTNPLRLIARGIGIKFDSTGSYVVDHVHHDATSHSHDVVCSSNIINNTHVTGNVKNPVLFSGISHNILETEFNFAFNILKGSISSYSKSSNVKNTQLFAGYDNLYISGLEARNGARVIVSGSLDFFSNLLFDKSIVYPTGENIGQSGNLVMSKALADWVFGGVGKLRATVSHKCANTEEAPRHYRINNLIKYEAKIDIYDGKKWLPYEAKDIQVEFIMLDPYIRKTLDMTSVPGLYANTIKLPDVYGMYTFKLYYRRDGLGVLDIQQIVGVHPTRHDQYERNIFMAYPYYLSSFSLLITTYIFAYIYSICPSDLVASIHKKNN